jgi:hypothetical protein
VVVDNLIEMDVNFHNGDGGQNPIENNQCYRPSWLQFPTLGTGDPAKHAAPGYGNILFNNDAWDHVLASDPTPADATNPYTFTTYASLTAKEKSLHGQRALHDERGGGTGKSEAMTVRQEVATPLVLKTGDPCSTHDAVGRGDEQRSIGDRLRTLSANLGKDLQEHTVHPKLNGIPYETAPNITTSFRSRPRSAAIPHF